VEKNGAIGSHTPCSNPNCCRKEKQARQLELPLEDTSAAYDKAEDGIMKTASDVVKNASKQ
jgi:hypothetical protein